VFRKVCLRQPGDAQDRSKVAEITASFSANGHKLKDVFVATADYCKGE
jgi:hypothetical protein